MSRLNLKFALLVFFAFAGFIFGERRFDSRDWQARISIFLPEEQSAEVFYIRLSPVMLRASSADLADLRIVDADGKEVPYVIQELRGSEISRSFLAEPLDKEQKEKRSVTMKIEGPPVRINRVLLVCRGFFTSTAILEVSADGKRWREVFRDGVYRTPLQNPNRTPVEKLTLDFPETEAAFIRIRMEDFSPWTQEGEQEPFQLYSVQPEYVEKTMTSYVGVEQRVEPAEETDEGTVSWDVTLPEGITADHLEVSIAEAGFKAKYRVYRLRQLSNGTWRKGQILVSGELIRENRLPGNPISIPIPSLPLPARIRLTLEPENLPDLTLTYLSVRAIEKRIVFKALGKAPYAIYLGNRWARAPRYSARDTVELLRRRAAPVAAVGQLAWNPEYQPTSLFRSVKQLITLTNAAALFAFFLLIYLLRRKHATRTMKPAEGHLSRPRA